MKRMIFATPFLSFMALIAPLTSCSEKQNGFRDAQIYTASAITNATRDSVNNEVTSTRRNAITRAVAKASPAVVGINVTEIREQRIYDPFQDFGSDDPFFRQFFQRRGQQTQKYKVEGLVSGFIISPD